MRIKQVALASIFALAFGGSGILCLGADTQPSANLSASVRVTAESNSPAGEPIVLHVTVSNTGDVAFSYWFAGPENYPSANHFYATATGVDGITRQIEPTNGNLSKDRV
ncbi:MAG TPA: hypothetical protein VGN88_06920 [Phycisphaerae bacterium]|jgi:hypothetical protein